jgi:hypothetical protein
MSRKLTSGEIELAQSIFGNSIELSKIKIHDGFNGVGSTLQSALAGMVVELGDAVIGGAWATADSYILSDGPLFVSVQGIAELR